MPLQPRELPGVVEKSLSSAPRRRLRKSALKKIILTRPEKRGGTYGPAAAILSRVTLTCEDYLGKEMPADVCEKVREAIVERVLGTREGDFSDSFMRKGTIVFVCADKEWLEQNAGNIAPAPGLKLRVVLPDDTS